MTEIIVLVLGMDNRKLATLRAAFKTYTQKRYQLSNDAPGRTPDIALVEMDGIDAKHLWQEFRKQYPQLPAIMLSAFPQPRAPVAVLMKPIQLEKLFALLPQVLSQPVTSQPEIITQEESEPTSKKRPPEFLPAHTSPTQTFYLPENIEYFDYSKGILGTLLEIKKQNKPTMIKIAGQISLIVVPQNKTSFALNLPNIENGCLNLASKIQTLPFTTGALPTNLAPLNFNNLLWQVSLWTSRGRLLNGINPDTLLRLRHWPNLTRLATIPDAMRIAALWTRHPANLQLTVRMLNIPPQHIFDFLAASYSIGILDLPEDGITPPNVIQSTPNNQSGGLLMRLLRKITGIK